MRCFNTHVKKYISVFSILFIFAAILFYLSGCEMIQSKIQGLKGDLIGNSFDYYEYDSFGNHIVTGHGDKVNLEGVRTVEYSYGSDGSLNKQYTLSSVVNITIDGKQHVACGSSLIFVEDGLTEVDVELPSQIGDDNAASSSWTSISSWINGIKNKFGASKVVVIKSELGYPLAVFQGNSVYWEVCAELPKTTKLSVDGKALYIHRTQFDIIDVSLL